MIPVPKPNAGAGSGAGAGAGASLAPLFVRDVAKGRNADKRSKKAWPEIYDRAERKPRSYQTDARDRIVDQFNRGMGSLVQIGAGMGKTKMVTMVFQALQESGDLDRIPHLLVTTPKTAMKTVRDELKMCGLAVKELQTRKSAVSRSGAPLVKTPVPFTVTLIEHDSMRRMTSLPNGDYVIVIDEVHLTMNATQRTSFALMLAKTARLFIGMTGTMITDSNWQKVKKWLELVVQYEVTPRNLWTAAAEMISYDASTGVNVVEETLDVEFPPLEREEYRQLVTPRFGGTATACGPRSFQEAMSICFRVCDVSMANKTVECLDDGVLLVGRNGRHQQTLKALLVKMGVPERLIFVMDNDSSVNLTKLSATPYRVVIGKIRQAEGFTLSAFGTLVWATYPSNEASREQMSKRLNRLSQTRKTIHFYKFRAGLLRWIDENHSLAASMAATLRHLAKEVDLTAEMASADVQ